MRVSGQNLSILSRYGIATLLIALAFAARWMLDPVVGTQVPLFTFVVATLISAISLGIGPTAFTMAAGFFLAEWFFAPPRQTFELDAAARYNMLAFLVLGLGSAVLGEIVRRQRERFSRQLGEMRSMLERETQAQSALIESQRMLSDAAELSERRAREASYHEGRARDSEETLALAVECAALGTWDIDPVAGTILWSDRSKVMFGLAPDDEINYERFLNFVHPDDREQVATSFLGQRVVDRHGQIETEFRTFGRGRPERWIRAKGRAFYDEQGKPVRLIGTMIDCTEQKRLTEAMRIARDSADSANQAKSAFLANMSHEIRTPLNAIMGFSEMLLDPALSDDERHDCVSTISRNGQMLARLIDDILDLSKVEANRLDLEREPLSLSNMMAEVAAVVADMARRGGVLVEMVTEPGVPEMIESDPVRLRQILINIVGNAVKFTQNGKVTVTARVIDETIGQGAAMVLGFEVKDQGPGIAKEHRRALFRPFQQSDASTTRRFGGTGLGLALARRLARALGGDVKLTASEVGRGSTFLATVKVVRSPTTTSKRVIQQQDDQAVRSPIFADLTGHKVLVVEDTPDSQFLIRRILLKAGAEVETASDGAEALRKTEGMTFDTILMDIQMPLVDGYEATATLRKRGYRKPIIALTAHAMKEDQEKTLQSGFDDHITKPIHPVSLVATVARHIERRAVN